MASCLAGTGLLFLSLSTIACGIGFLSPYWLLNESWDEVKGLWGQCNEKQEDYDGVMETWRKCHWFFEEDWAWERSLEGWWKVCQVFFSLGYFILLVTFMLACAQMCCPCKGDRGMHFAIGALDIISFLMIMIALATFAGQAHSKWDVGSYGNFKYQWGYWTAVGGLNGLVVAGFFYILAACCAQSSSGGEYHKANVQYR